MLTVATDLFREKIINYPCNHIVSSHRENYIRITVVCKSIKQLTVMRRVAQFIYIRFYLECWGTFAIVGNDINLVEVWADKELL